jgi:hypothetical protein
MTRGGKVGTVECFRGDIGGGIEPDRDFRGSHVVIDRFRDSDEVDVPLEGDTAPIDGWTRI